MICAARELVVRTGPDRGNSPSCEERGRAHYMDSLLAGKLILPFRGRSICDYDVQRHLWKSFRNHRERHSGSARRPFAFPSESRSSSRGIRTVLTLIGLQRFVPSQNQRDAGSTGSWPRMTGGSQSSRNCPGAGGYRRRGSIAAAPPTHPANSSVVIVSESSSRGR
jgi:hypothetical protein